MDGVRVPLIRDAGRREQSGSSNWYVPVFALILLVSFIVGVYFLDRTLFVNDNEDRNESSAPSNLWKQIQHGVSNLTVGEYSVCHWYTAPKFDDMDAVLDGESLNITWEKDALIFGSICDHATSEVILLVPFVGNPSGSFSLEGIDLVLDKSGTNWIRDTTPINATESPPEQWHHLYDSFQQYRKTLEQLTTEAPGVDGFSVGMGFEYRRKMRVKHHELVMVHLILEIKDGTNDFADPITAIKYASALISVVSEDLFYPIGIDLRVGSIVLNSQMFMSGSASVVSYLHALEDNIRPHGAHVIVAMTTRSLGSMGWPGGVYNGRIQSVAGGLVGHGLIRNDRRQVATAILELFGSPFTKNLTVEDMLSQIKHDFYLLKDQFKVISSGYSMMSDDCFSEESESGTNETSLLECQQRCSQLPYCVGFNYNRRNETCIINRNGCDDVSANFDFDPWNYFARDAFADSPPDYFPFAGGCGEGKGWKTFEGVSRVHCGELCKETKGCRGFSLRTNKYRYESTCVLETIEYETCETTIGVCDSEVQWCFYGLEWFHSVPLHFAPLKANCNDNELMVIEDLSLSSCADACDSNSTCRGFSFKKDSECVLKSKVCDQPIGSCDWTEEVCFFEKLFCENGITNEANSGCCAKECDTCGGIGCSSLAAGADNCCLSHFEFSCGKSSDIACLIPK